MSSYTFTFPKTEGVEDVLVVGSFDNWVNKLPLVKTPAGDFELCVPLPSGLDTVEFKFITNGTNWITSETYETSTDESGNVNNVAKVSHTGAVKTAKIPESGGIETVIASKEPEIVTPPKEILKTKEEEEEEETPETKEDVKYVKKVHKKVEKSSLKTKLKNLFS